MSEYYIVSLKWTRGDLITFWGSENSGYTTSLNSAGVYTQAQVEGSPGYYNNGLETLAVPTDIIDGMAEPFVRHGSNRIADLRAVAAKQAALQ